MGSSRAAGEQDILLISNGEASLTKYIQRFRRCDTNLDRVADQSQSYTENDSYLTMEQNGLLLEPAPTVSSLASLHPPIDALPRFREIYLDRVDPLTKVLHLPSFLASLEAVVKSPHQVSRGLEALCFSYYLVAVSTFDDSECSRILGVDKAFAFRQYRIAARQALMNAEYLSSSSVEVLQAFALFLVGAGVPHRRKTLTTCRWACGLCTGTTIFTCCQESQSDLPERWVFIVTVPPSISHSSRQKCADDCGGTLDSKISGWQTL